MTLCNATNIATQAQLKTEKLNRYKHTFTGIERVQSF